VDYRSLFNAEVAWKGLFYFHGGVAMLVLSRRVGEQIVIGDDIRITVVAVQGNKVRIGVSAPPTVCVDRHEVNERRNQWSASPWNRKSAPGDCKVPDLSRAN